MQTASSNEEPRNRRDERRPAGTEVGELLHHFVGDVPWQDQDLVDRVVVKVRRGDDRDVAPGHELPLLVPGRIAHEWQQVGFDAGEIEEGITLRCRAVRRDLLPGSLRLDQEGEQVELDRLRPRLERFVDGQ